MMRVSVSTVIVRGSKENQEVLLLYRVRGRESELWEFPGGKVEVGEAIKDAASRELTEEAAIVANDLQQFAMMEHYVDDKWWLCVFYYTHIDNVVNPSDIRAVEDVHSMAKWFKLTEIPYIKCRRTVAYGITELQKLIQK